MNKLHRIAALALAFIMTFALVSMPFSAAAENTLKEEVVYVDLANDGSVSNIYVVNIFDMEIPGSIRDFGDYTAVRNMTSTSEIKRDGDMISVNAPDGRFYYEGTLAKKELPWIMEFKYALDGVIYEAEDIAGKSGALKIMLSIKENPMYQGEFFDTHALQVTFSLDTEKCENIVAEGATLANVGKNKQITYTVLGGSGAEIEITADVKDFEMPAVTLNGVRLKLDINLDSSLFSEKLREVIGVFGIVSSGAGQLSGSISQVESATGSISSGANSLNNGVATLEQGAQSLHSGIEALNQKGSELVDGAKAAYQGLCMTCQTVLNMTLTANGMEKVTLTPDNYEEVLSSIIKVIDIGLVYENAYLKAEATVREEVEKRADELYYDYVLSHEDAIYDLYVQGIANELYLDIAQESVYAYYLSLGYSETISSLSLNSARGKELTNEALKKITDEQKQQILESARAALTNEEKEEILRNAAENLDEEQKTLLKDGYINQLMKSAPILAQINAAVSTADTVLSQLVSLKGQLDSFKLFCDGVTAYTSAVGDLLEGSESLSKGLSDLKSNTKILSSSLKQLHNSVRQLNEGTSELMEGANSFDSETFDLKLDAEIDAVLSSITGTDSKLESFVSEKNVNIESVQFVIKTEGISIPEPPALEKKAEAKLSLWQKFLKLFGLYKG